MKERIANKHYNKCGFACIRNNYKKLKELNNRKTL